MLGFVQLDSMKSRLQTIKHPISVPRLALLVYREEGVIGFYRGLWIPLITISFVRGSYSWNDIETLCTDAFSGAASFTIYSKTKEDLRNRNLLIRNNLIDTSCIGGIGYLCVYLS